MNKSFKIIVITLCILILCISIILGIILFKPKEKEVIPNKYNANATKVMDELNIKDKINKLDYSKTLEVILENNLYQDKYLDKYIKIDYIEFPNFINYVNDLLNKNYNSEEINYLFKYYLDNINIFLNMDYIDILQFKDITNFDLNKLDRYLNYQKANNYDMKTVVTYVNIGLDLEGYSKYVEYTEEEAKNLSILVNKYHKLPDDYEPDDLVSLSYNVNYKLRKEAADAFEKLTSAGILDNIYFYPFSPYRSFSTQNTLYNMYKNRDGEAKADTYSARPGFSEHQLGLAVDVRSSTLNDNLTPEDYEWMLNNSYKYGFIVRYPKGKQHITQFMEEPWHIRYLGVDLATKVHDSGLTYDEYYDLYLETH